MSRAEEIRAKAQRTQDRRTTEDPAPATAPRVKATPVRKTVDLPPQTYTRLSTWCAETAGELAVTRVTGQDVMATLVTRMLDDPELAAAIREDLAAEYRRRQTRRS